ncbi:MAG: fimbrillin family protein [Bacteroidales bacterium]|nr:fimbrillin family protein [Candidatus Scybalocola fimicaballi]
MMRVRLHNISIKCMLAILLAGLVASCKDDDEANDNDFATGDEIRFSALRDGFQKPVTRWGEKEEFFRDEQVSVLAMKSSNGSVWERVFVDADENSIDVLPITYKGESIWHYDKKQKWQNDYTYKFRGFFPCLPSGFNTVDGETCANGFEFPKTDNKVNGSTTLTLNNYKSASDPRHNTDLMVSQQVTRNNNPETVVLDMKHLLANVSFKFQSREDKPVTITDFSVVGYASEGNCTINENNVVGWEPKVHSSSKSEATIEMTLSDIDKTVSYTGDKYVIKSSDNNKELTFEDVCQLCWNPSKINTAYVSAASGYVKLNEGIDRYQGYLFIPQDLKNDSETIKLTIKTYVDYAYGTQHQVSHTFDNVELKRDIYGEVEFYFGNTDPGVGKRLKARVDLTAGNKIDKWVAGTKYTYTVGMYEYQVNVNIDVADWDKHEYEGELK